MVLVLSLSVAGGEWHGWHGGLDKRGVPITSLREWYKNVAHADPVAKPRRCSLGSVATRGAVIFAYLGVVVSCAVAPTARHQPTPLIPEAQTPPPSPPEPAEGQPSAPVWIRQIDGAEMVFVPAGDFVMGSNTGAPDESPQHAVQLDAFWIDRYEVTNEQYTKCVRVGVCAPSRCPDDSLVNAPNQPVVCVTWHDAVQYANWVGGRLPTEAEWEKAARGTDGREYPWGDEFDRAKCNDGWGGFNPSTSPGQYSPEGDSPYGVANMAGNVSEWTSSLYRPYPYHADDGREDPVGDEARVVRGGSSSRDFDWYFRCAYRNWALPGGWLFTYGFRVAVCPGSPE